MNTLAFKILLVALNHKSRGHGCFFHSGFILKMWGGGGGGEGTGIFYPACRICIIQSDWVQMGVD